MMSPTETPALKVTTLVVSFCMCTICVYHLCVSTCDCLFQVQSDVHLCVSTCGCLFQVQSDVHLCVSTCGCLFQVQSNMFFSLI